MIKAIIAVELHSRGIGINNQLPWRIPSDLKHFKETTMGDSVLMGYNTMLSLGKPLPGRTNYVLTRFKEPNLPEGFVGVQMVQGLRDFFALVGKREDLWVIGGAKTYEICAPYIKEWVITWVDAPGVAVDCVWDDSVLQEFVPMGNLPIAPSEKDEHSYQITQYQRRTDK
ncbi:hypothetical protein pEaSNUABM54_00023 [Erwinia phage pEa_SNUABM_54]|nr:hypothetical protein pEaSNUABM54_00023 [Erwinia phage pEa_SNUABM_54]